MGPNYVELLLGWLAILVAGAVAVLTYVGGFIAASSVEPDFIGLAVILLAMAIGVTVDSLVDFLPARIVLGLATLLLAMVAVVSFLAFLVLSALLAAGATLLAFIRPHPDRN
jgi:predicted branched-subunit amino acid permease